MSQGIAAVVASIADAVVIKDGDLFLLFRPDGDLPLTGGHGFGLYYHDCRYLSGYTIRLAGSPPEPLAAAAEEGFRALVQLTNPQLRRSEGRRIRKETLGLAITRHLHGARLELTETISIHNYDHEAVRLPIDLSFAAGFEDVYVIRGLWPERPGRIHPPQWQHGALSFAYEGADDIRRELRITFDPPPTRAEDAHARFELQLDAAATSELRLTFSLHETPPIEEEPQPPGRPAARHADVGDRWLDRATQVRSDSLLLNAVIDRSLRDIQTLRSSLGEEHYLAAGVPWFVTLFGRDSLITALQVLAFDPRVAEDTLRLLAARRGRRVDAWRDEEPGKILHELRVGELARLRRIPHTPYYGTVDATPLFLLLLARHAAWTGSLALFTELRDAVESALAWMHNYGDRNGDGYLEYRSASGEGLANQGWKDSGDAIVNADGSLARPPISVVEVQGYAYAARMELASVFERAGEEERAASLRSEAKSLRERLNRDYWLPDLGTYALALQRDGEPCAVVSSNPGHLLWSGVAEQEKADSAVEMLMASHSFNGWGIRTLSEREVRYNPIGYHLGTVWPHDNDLIAAGFRRYGHDGAALRLATALLEAAMHFDEYRLPEAFAGYPRSAFHVPVRYPVACHPQAWAAGTSPHLVETLLGLEPDAFARRLTVARPLLPPFVDRIQVDSLRVGEARVSLEFERHAESVAVRTLEVEGQLQVAVLERP